MIHSHLSVTKVTPLASRGLVVAEHPLGAEVGAGILKRGGNAVDAAVATAFAMTVVEPFMSTIAGGGTMVIYLARRGEGVALNFNVQAPAACHERIFPLADGVAGDLFPWRRVVDDQNIVGHRAVAVPGSVAGLCLALERYGTMDLADILKPAIALARDGLIPDWYLALTTAVYAQELTAFPETARTYLRDGRHVYRPPGLAEGDRVRYPDLARSLELIAKEGPRAFYHGALAEAIHEEMAAHGGFLTRDDLAAYQVRVGPPLRGRYRDLDLLFSPGATAGITSLEILNILGVFPGKQVGFDSPRGLHLRAEAVRYAFLDRLTYLGDADRIEAPWAALASKEYAAAVGGLLKPGGPRSAKPAPDPWRFEGKPAAHRRRAAGRVGGGDSTTHIGVVDRQRNLVSLTNTAVSLFGSRVVVPGTGILLGNGMIWFDPEPGKPNSVGSRKRALVNMVPVVTLRRGVPYLTLGAPGGRKIVSAIPQVLANLADLGLSPQAAIEAPRLHTEGQELWVDSRVGEKALAQLRRMGHSVVSKHEDYSTFYLARPVAIRVGKKGLEAGLDHLRAAAAAGH
ncbi:MAG: gamma-glutamyltransferase [Candidatus Methylomirabilia bacterium]